MHVLIIPTELYLPPLQPLSGIFQGHQARVMVSHGVKVGVVSCGYISWRYAYRRYPYPSAEHSDGVDVLRQFRRPVIPGRFAIVHMRDSLIARSMNLVREYTRRFGMPDLVHAHNTFSAGLIAARVRKEFGVPFVLTEHDSSLVSTLASTRNLDLARETFESAGLLSAVGTSVARQMLGAAPDAGRECLKLGNVLDPLVEARARAVAPEQAARPESEFVWLAIGGLIPIKNHALLLRAFSAAFKGDPGVTLRIGGDGPLEGRLRALASELGIEGQVRFLGYLDREHVIREIRNCDAMVLSSLAETFGVVLIEALAFGKPVLSTRSGGPEDIVHERVGLLVDGDDASFAAGLRRVREARYDAETVSQYCFGSWGAEAFWSRLAAAYAVALGQTRLTDLPGAWRIGAGRAPDERA